MLEAANDVIVTDRGFAAAEPRGNDVLTLENTADAIDVVQQLNGVTHIEVKFPSFADGRGFSLAINLRRAGFTGHLRAVGHLIPDQYAHARRCGFDDVAISQASAKRQPQHQWLEQVQFLNTTYQTRLQQAASVK